MKTDTDLVRKTLFNLSRLDVGEEPSAEDAQVVRDGMQPLFDELSARDILHVECGGEIEDRFFESLATMLASRVGPGFGVPRDRGVEQAEIATLRNVNRSPAAIPPMRPDYF